MSDAEDATPDAPLTLIERLRNTAINLTTTWVAADANGDPLNDDDDGMLETTEFEPEELHDLAALMREAATALEAYTTPEQDPMVAVLRASEAAAAQGWPRTLAVMETTAGNTALIEVGQPSPAMRQALLERLGSARRANRGGR